MKQHYQRVYLRQRQHNCLESKVVCDRVFDGLDGIIFEFLFTNEPISNGGMYNCGEKISQEYKI